MSQPGAINNPLSSQYLDNALDLLKAIIDQSFKQSPSILTQTGSVHLFLYLYSQGDFDRWVDGTLLTESSWYDPKLHGQKDVNLTLQSLNLPIFDANTFERKEYFQSTWKKKQPDPSLSKNCTAALVDANPLLYMKWFVIPCQRTFISTYRCEYTKLNENATRNLQNSNLPCTKGWFGVDGVNKCYTAVQSSPYMMLSAAKNQCAIMNSTLLGLVGYGTVGNKNDLKMIDVLHELLGNNTTKLELYKEVLLGIYNRIALNQSNFLLSFLYHYCYANDVDMRVLVTVNEKCAVAEYSNKTITQSPQWTAEFCSRYIQADTFICEKPSQPHSTMCDLNYYRCLDGTCVLTLYVCDSVRDCVDGEDEMNCPPVVLQKASLRLQNDSLYLPCPLYHSCNSSFVTPVKIHTICDNMLNPWLTNFNEHEMCIQRNIDKLDLHSLILNSYHKIDQQFSISSKMENLLQKIQHEKNDTMYFSEKGIAMEIVSFSDTTYFKIRCHNNENLVKVADMCKIVHTVNQCALKYRHRFCQLMSCPGMFRCRGTYCIYMSAVCDGQTDCPYGEDEEACTHLSCPGFLKCRGESRCISPQQICDGHVDCKSSFDDEIQCNNCPHFCKCDGYVLSCNLQNTLGSVTKITMVHSKAYIFSGVQSSVSLDVFNTSSGIFLDVSDCAIQDIVFSIKSHTVHQHLLFCDISNNTLMGIKFLLAEVLRKVIVLDLSYNYISALTSKYFRLAYLIVLYIRHNPLTLIEITNSMISLEYCDLQNVLFNWGMKVITNNFKVEIMVTNSMICCFWPKEVKCLYVIQNERCYGLINNSAKKIIFLSIVILATSLNAFVSIRTVYEKMHKKHIKSNYITAKLNFMVSSLFAAMSLTVLSVLGMIQINVITWRKSIGCHIINGAMSLSLGTMFVHKIISLFLVAMKIIYPFAHQCLWVNKTFLVCSITWLVGVIFYSVNIGIVILQKDHEFDKFCTICDCHIRGFYRLMYYFICSVDLFSILFFIVIFGKTILVLIEKNKQFPSRKINLPKILFGFVKQIVPQLLFILFLYSIPLVKIISQFLQENYCFAVFLFVLPFVIICDSLLAITM